jgi:hypothetical protein
MSLEHEIPEFITPLAAQVLGDTDWHAVALPAHCCMVDVNVAGAACNVVPSLVSTDPAHVGKAIASGGSDRLCAMGCKYLLLNGNGATVGITAYSHQDPAL